MRGLLVLVLMLLVVGCGSSVAGAGVGESCDAGGQCGDGQTCALLDLGAARPEGVCETNCTGDGGACPSGFWCHGANDTLDHHPACVPQQKGDTECGTSNQCASGQCRDAGFFAGAYLGICAPAAGGEAAGEYCVVDSDCASMNCAPDAGPYGGACAPGAGH